MERKVATRQIVHHLRNPQPPLPNGCSLLAIANHDEHTHRIIALRERPGLTDEFVVWYMDQDANCFWGHYFPDDLDAALEYFVQVTSEAATAA